MNIRIAETQNTATFSYSIVSDSGSATDAPLVEHRGLLAETTYIMPIDKLPDSCWEVQIPIQAYVTKEAEEFRVEIPEIEVCGFSDSIDDALIDVVDEICQLCDEIIGMSEKRLGRSARQWKKYLLDHVKVDG